MDVSVNMELYIQGDTAEILLKNKRTGAVWTSNPAGRFDDALAQGGEPGTAELTDPDDI